MRRVGIAAVLLVALALAGWAVIVMVAAGLPQPGDLATRAPVATQVMRDRVREAAAHGRRLRIERVWVPYERISPLLRRAVLIAEDDAFFSHDGLDWDEIGQSARANLRAGRIVRGGSTITQQLAKNLWLGGQRTLTRKLAEMILALRLERALTKRRIFELYLNEIEWGDGVFGIEAASRHWFGTTSADLTPRQAAYLAAVIINPRRYSPADPSRRIERRAHLILSRMHRRGFIDDADYARALGLPPPDTTRGADTTGRIDTTAAGPLSPPATP
ncbi:MAG TPA: monofunctional biosynthetic peptidoglycan transglycosylase [Dongiaceae bacterium]|nr:monofunctional biosynthetic peptidoglycan transglycosylase [Dongiaceae bacterium]